MILREVDNLAPVRTAENFWDNFYLSIGWGQPAEPAKTAEEQKQFDWTTLAIIGIIGVVIFSLIKK